MISDHADWDELTTTLAELERLGCGILNVDFKRSSLQDVFLELVKR